VDEKYLTINEACEYLGVTRTTMYEWMNSGKLRYHIVGSRRRIAQKDMAAFIREGNAEKSPEKEEALAA
jgi:excisionase family DNA binding protein